MTNTEKYYDDESRVQRPISHDELVVLASVEYYSPKDMSPRAVAKRAECMKIMEEKARPFIQAIRDSERPSANDYATRVGVRGSFGIGFSEDY